MALLFSPPPLPFPSPLPFTPPLPLEAGPLNPTSESGESCKLPSGVWGRAPADVKFGNFHDDQLIKLLLKNANTIDGFKRNW